MFYIQVGDHRVAIHPDTKVKICPTSLGCTMVGGNDLFDLGFKCKEIDEHGVWFHLGEDSLYCKNKTNEVIYNVTEVDTPTP